MMVRSLPSASTVLKRAGILVVEDDALIATHLAQAFKEAGLQVVGPAPSVRAALALLAGPARLGGAVLEINLCGETVYPVADELARRGVPFLFASASEAGAIPARFAHVTCCEKPFDVNRVVFLLQAQQGRQDRSQASRSKQGQGCNVH